MEAWRNLGVAADLLMSPLTTVQQALLRRFSQVSSCLSHSCRHASSKRKPASIPKLAGGPKATKSIPRVSPSHDAGSVRLSPVDTRRIYAAKQLYDSGIRNIYKSPSHVGKLGFSWLVATFFIGNSLRMYYEGYYKLRPGHGYGSKTKTAVEAINRLTMIFFTVVGGYAVLRYNGLVRSLDLVRTTSSNMVQLRISVRRAIPILKPKEYIVPAYMLRLPYKWRFHSERLPDIAPPPPSAARRLGRVLWSGFKKFQSYLLMDGMLAVDFETHESGKIKALLDTHGTFTRNMGDLEAMSHEVQPWEQ